MLHSPPKRSRRPLPPCPASLAARRRARGDDALTGSALIALALARGRFTAEQAWQVANVDEDWNREQWGSDETALEHSAARFAELQAAATVLSFTCRLGRASLSFWVMNFAPPTDNVSRFRSIFFLSAILWQRLEVDISARYTRAITATGPPPGGPWCSAPPET